MLDIKFVRQNADRVRKVIQLKQSKNYLDRILELDNQKRQKQNEFEKLRASQNKENETVAQAKKSGQDTSEMISRLGKISDQIKSLETEINAMDTELEQLMLWLPNIPLPEVAEGGEEKNSIVRHWGEQKKFAFQPKPHWELGASLGMFELERGSRIAGSGFPMLAGDGARLQRAIINFMLDTHHQHGYKEVATPYLVNRRTITGTGQVPKLEEDMYRLEKDDLFLIPTAEVPLTNFFQGELIPGENLPIYIVGYSPCFRREAGSAGKDTRGLLRVHQFNKVELIHFVREEDSSKSLEIMVGHASAILEKLNIPYRIVLLAAGDSSFSSAKTYDIEIWAPGVDRWLEVSSCSTCTDFQARRINMRYKVKGGKPKFVHTLNGSGVALPRLIAAVMENYQQQDGHISVPDALRPYLGGQERI
jgi:seryl-tRNA synthetase